MDISLTKMPWYAQVGAFLALSLAGVYVFYAYYEAPTRTDLNARRQQLVLLKANISKGLETARKLPEFRAEVTELESRLASLKAVLPEEKDAADLLRRMQVVATQSALVIKTFKPAPIVTKQLHAEWPINLELDGTYHNLALFFDRIGKFTRIVNVSDLAVKGKDRPEPNSTITATCVATTFVLLDKQTAAAKPASAPRRGAAPAKGT
jgi:type IV pilus assembly protein PilO